MTRVFRLLFGVLFSALFLNCSFNQMLPSRRLQKGEVVRTVSITEPGFLYLPRLNYSETRGTGTGDWSVFLNGTVGIVGAGIARRHYLVGGRKNVGIQMSADHSFFKEDLWGQSLSANFLTITPSLDISPPENKKVFTKAYGVLLSAMDANWKGERVWLAGAGLAVGADYLLKNGHSFSWGVNIALLCSKTGCGLLPSLSVGYAFRKKKL